MSKATAKEWQRLEAIVAQLEKLLGGEAEVTTGWLPDKDTGHKRQIDVIIRAVVGSIPFLGIIECRKRQKVSDVRWVEEVAQKRISVSADKAIIVGELTRPARDKAAALNIEVRTFKQSQKAEFIQKVFPLALNHVSLHYQLLDPGLNLYTTTTDEQKKKFQDWAVTQTSTNAFIVHTSDPSTPMTLVQMVDRAHQMHSDNWDECREYGKPIYKKFKLQLAELINGEYQPIDGSGTYHMKVGDELIGLEAVQAGIRFWTQLKKVTLASSAAEYSSGDDRPAFLRTGYYKLDKQGHSQTLAIHTRHDGRVAMQLLPEDDPQNFVDEDLSANPK